MTTAAYHSDSKLCPVCGARFYRRRSASPSSFRHQITCSRSCGNVHAADPSAHPPKREPDRRRPEADKRWRHQAACRWHDPELFFPVGSTGPAAAQIAEAKAVCQRCPVMEACRSWALEAGADADAGVWGGLDEDERRALKRRNARLRAKAAVS